jgi:cell wall-associated NlpC family hydrolase
MLDGMDSVLGSLPASFLEVPFSERMIPGRDPELGLTAGSNCQRYAYAVLQHFGLSVPDFRSSELWTDEAFVTTVPDPAPLDLVLYAATPDEWGAHVGVYLGANAVLHLCKEIGVPVVWDFEDFAARERYRWLIGFKRVRRPEPGARA